MDKKKPQAKKKSQDSMKKFQSAHAKMFPVTTMKSGMSNGKPIDLAAKRKATKGKKKSN